MSRNIVHLPIKETYDLWAATYDTDGNILQSLDSYALQTILLPRLFSTLQPKSQTPPSDSPPPPLQITDLGCGTGRVSLALLNALKDPANAAALTTDPSTTTEPLQIHLHGLDSSTNMLSHAKARFSRPTMLSLLSQTQTPTPITISTTFSLYDMLSSPSPPPASQNPPPQPADILLCSLVLEHAPSVPQFFAHLTSNLLKPSALLLLTNMHPDMARGADPIESSSFNDPATGRLHTQAGFVDPDSGDKIRPVEDWAHSVKDVMDAAREYGFELVGDGEAMEELGVERWMIEGGVVDAKRGEKWARGGVKCWFGGLFRYVGKR